MSTSQSAGQAARPDYKRLARPSMMQSSLRLFINFLEWISRNEAANRGLGTVTSFISVCAVVIAVYQYYATASERELQTELAIWADITNNTGQKDAIQLLAMHGVAMNSIHLTAADLSTVHIARANLSYSDIENSNLSNADLTGVEFAGATIRDDDFSYANLTGADLNNLNLDKPVHSDNFSGAIMPADANLPAISAISCIGLNKSGAILWPEQNGRQLDWPVDAQGHAQMCDPPKRWQARCHSAWCNPAFAKKPWYDFAFLLPAEIRGSFTANAATVPAQTAPPATPHQAAARKPAKAAPPPPAHTTLPPI